MKKPLYRFDFEYPGYRNYQKEMAKLRRKIEVE
jgi:hypothetical protein